MSRTTSAFTLVEVIVALGVMAVGVVGILALLGPATDASRELSDAAVAARLVERVRTELAAARDSRRVEPGGALMALRDEFGAGWRIVADQRGERVFSEVAADGADGLAERSRYFLIEVDLHDGVLRFPADAAFVAWIVQVRWPYRLATGAEGPAIAVDGARMHTHTTTVVLSP
ncbi:MAG TPA: type II secretion system protein [Candidatus Synoicihabitans sp.]|nr:type II secretion system protein [Candidatus Synoicihabitans sp.]